MEGEIQPSRSDEPTSESVSLESRTEQLNREVGILREQVSLRRTTTFATIVITGGAMLLAMATVLATRTMNAVNQMEEAQSEIRLLSADLKGRHVELAEQIAGFSEALETMQSLWKCGNHSEAHMAKTSELAAMTEENGCNQWSITERQ